MFLRFFHRWRCSRAQNGFSLIEMLVVVTIFLIITAVVIADFPAFRDKTALQLIAQEIATTIRQAQVYGIGTRAAGTAAFTSNGIYLDLQQPNSFGLDNKSFILYADTDDTDGYQTGDTEIERFAIRGGAEIVNLQGCNASSCSDLTPKKLDIFFQRFYPEATFSGTAAGSSYVQIVLQSTRNTNNKREIQVWSTGQIVVNDISTQS